MNKINYFTTITIALISFAANAEVSNLCNRKEKLIWSCQTTKKIFSLCASPDLTAETGYLQYRVGNGKATEFLFPKSLLHPKGNFDYGLLAHGASMSFSNGSYNYLIAEDLKGGTVISVESPRIKPTTITCSASTETLTLNTTIDLFKAIGISK